MNKQYMLITDEQNMAFLAKVMPSLQFVEIKGMNVETNKDVQVLVTPKPPETEQTTTTEPANEPANEQPPETTQPTETA